MKRWFIAAAVLIGLNAGFSARAEETKRDMGKYLEQLQLKLDHTAQRINQPTANGSSVVGLRGSKQEPMSKQLYWKGKRGNAPVAAEEVKALRAAVDQAVAGRRPEAIAALKSFEQKYPRSGLLPDARDM